MEVLYEGVAWHPMTIPVAAANPSFFLAPGFSKTQAAAPYPKPVLPVTVNIGVPATVQ